MPRIVITGAASGLGAVLALAYAAPGVSLGLIDRDEARLFATAASCRAAGAEVHTLVQDVAVSAPLTEWLVALEDAAPIDLVIANAGTSAGPAPGAPEGLVLVTRQVATNLLGVVNTIEPLLPRFIARHAGHIVIVASIAALRGLPYSPGYSASKAGVRAYGEALRALLEPVGIRVCVICPGFFVSPMSGRWHGPRPWMISTERAAARIKRGIERRRRRITFPWLLMVGMRFADWMPPRLGDRVLRRFRFHILPPE
jgi:short-subunit dehydrogenase